MSLAPYSSSVFFLRGAPDLKRPVRLRCPHTSPVRMTYRNKPNKWLARLQRCLPADHLLATLRVEIRPHRQREWRYEHRCLRPCPVCLLRRHFVNTGRQPYEMAFSLHLNVRSRYRTTPSLSVGPRRPTWGISAVKSCQLDAAQRYRVLFPIRFVAEPSANQRSCCWEARPTPLRVTCGPRPLSLLARD
jgi:hypothetical protein